ncbi:MAG: ATP-grasp domain-containing protein [Aestuariivirga sp.]
MTLSGNVLVFGDDMRVFLTMVRALGHRGLTVHAVPFDRQAPALTSRYIAAIHSVPRYDAGAEAWVDAVLGLFDRHRIDLAIPCTDPTILMMDRHRARFSGHRLAIPAADTMDRFFDKAATQRMCVELGISTPPARLLTASDGAVGLAAEFGLPLVIKARRSYWIDRLDSAGDVVIADTASDIERALKGIGERERWLVQGYFAGDGGGLSVLAADGEILQAFQHRRLREGRGRASSFRVSEALNPGLLADCAKICAHTRHTGLCMFEFRHNGASGRWTLLEINARAWGSIGLPAFAGVDFPNLLYDLMTKDLRHPAIAYTAGLKSRNLLLDGFNLLNALKRSGLRGVPFALAEAAGLGLHPLSAALGREASDSFIRDDMRPGFKEIARLLWSG